MEVVQLAKLTKLPVSFRFGSDTLTALAELRKIYPAATKTDIVEAAVQAEALRRISNGSGSQPPPAA